MSQTIRYIHIREVCDFHQVEIQTIERLLDVGVVRADYRDDGPYVAEPEINRLETAIRIHRDLHVNPEGIDVILQLRQRMEALQVRMREMEVRLRRYE